MSTAHTTSSTAEASPPRTAKVTKPVMSRSTLISLMIEVGDREAYLYYTLNNKSQESLEQLIWRRLNIKERLQDREAKKINRRVTKPSSTRKVKFFLQEFEKQHIETQILRLELFRAAPMSKELFDIIDPLGGYGLVAYARIVSKWIENNADKIFSHAGWTDEEIKQRTKLLNGQADTITRTPPNA